MKKVFALFLAVAMSLALAACGSAGTAPAGSSAAGSSSAAVSSSNAQPVDLTVFAAASMTETMDQVIAQYKSVAPNVTIKATYDSSGILQTQIEQGADCDLFISAAQKQMNALDGSLKGDTDKNPDGEDFILQGSRVNILENKVVLVVSSGNPAGITSFNDLKTDKLKMIALGNSDVPVGSYSLDILAYLGLDVKAMESAGKITYGSNVKEVTTQVSEGTVDCGIVYATDAYSAGLTVVDTATSDMCKQVLYPAAVLKGSQNQEAAQAFLDYIRSDACTPIFEKVGFAVVK